LRICAYAVPGAAWTVDLVLGVHVCGRVCVGERVCEREGVCKREFVKERVRVRERGSEKVYERERLLVCV
jgi:hypothetical protein